MPLTDAAAGAGQSDLLKVADLAVRHGQLTYSLRLYDAYLVSYKRAKKYQGVKETVKSILTVLPNDQVTDQWLRAYLSVTYISEIRDEINHKIFVIEESMRGGGDASEQVVA